MVDFKDGKYEVLLIKRPKSLWNAFAICMSMINRSFKHEKIQLFQASDIQFEFNENVDWSLDGEKKNGGKTVSIKNHQCAVNIIRK